MKKTENFYRKSESKTSDFLLEGKVPPSSVDAEKYVLGALMSGFQYEEADKVLNMLQPEMFYKVGHGIIYSAILELKRQKQPIDISTVSEALKKCDNGDEAGGLNYLCVLAQDIASGAQVFFHALVVLENYIRRGVIDISTKSIAEAFDKSTPMDEVLSNLENKFTELTQLLNVKQDIYHIQTVANDAINEAYERIKKAEEGIPVGIPTGFGGLDALTFGWKPGELIILAARPSMGKTAVMLHFAKAAVNAERAALIFSLEMPKISIADRLLLSESDNSLNINHYKNGRMNIDERAVLERMLGRLEDKQIYINDTPGLTIGQIHASAKEAKRNRKCGIIFIDYLQLCKGKGVSNNRTRDIEVSEISREAKEMAKELSVPVVLLSQLSREVEKRQKSGVPQLSDLRDSGAIEQDADLVIFVYRPEYYKQVITDEYGKDIENYGELIVSKNRNGRCGKISYTHSTGMTKFYDYGTPRNL
jgi:replicative DNA helicase